MNTLMKEQAKLLVLRDPKSPDILVHMSDT